jgi:hypothetical protein
MTVNENNHSFDDPSPLHSAVKLGDLIRRHVREQPARETESKGFVESLVDPSQSTTTPGLLEGVAVSIITAGLLSPLRRYFIKATAQSMGIFTDLLASSTLVICSMMGGMYAGSLAGSTIYMKQLAAVPTESSSPTADAICQSEEVRRLLLLAKKDTSMSFHAGDPRLTTIRAYQAALQKCRDRTSLQDSGNSMGQSSKIW